MFTKKTTFNCEVSHPIPYGGGQPTEISSMGPTSDSSLVPFLFVSPMVPESSPADLVSLMCYFLRRCKINTCP